MPIDCEALHDGLVGQPANALTAFAFVGAALAVYRRSKPLSVALVILAAGSLSFHADQNSLSGWLDGFGVLLVLAAVIEHRLDRNAPLPLLLGAGIALGLLAIPEVLVTPVTLAVGLAAAVVVVRTTPLRQAITIAALGAIAVVFYLLGRNGAPLCDPESFFQPHAVWHVLAAVTISLVGLAPHRPI